MIDLESLESIYPLLQTNCTDLEEINRIISENNKILTDNILSFSSEFILCCAFREISEDRIDYEYSYEQFLADPEGYIERPVLFGENAGFQDFLNSTTENYIACRLSLLTNIKTIFVVDPDIVNGPQDFSYTRRVYVRCGADILEEGLIIGTASYNGSDISIEEDQSYTLDFIVNADECQDDLVYSFDPLVFDSPQNGIAATVVSTDGATLKGTCV